MMSDKPSWDDAPDWAMFLAQDEYGAWGWYESKPVVFDGYCWDIEKYQDKWCRPKNFDAFSRFMINSKWRETLEARP